MGVYFCWEMQIHMSLIHLLSTQSSSDLQQCAVSVAGESENEDVEKRIKSLLAHLQAESAILDKIIYKSKNQHRRSFYFQYLLKVRRDVKLLQSADLEEILNFHFQVIDEKKPNNCAKKRKLSSVKYPFHMRLLGVARLLSQMVEPMVKAAIELSALLARSFFMRFSLLLCALLARLRVLVQQILLDVVSVFNMFSPSLQGSQSTVLSFRGIKVIREYHPSDNDVRALECVWETDKFVLLEKTSSDDVTDTRKHVGGGTESPLKSSNITYQTIEAFLGDDELGCQKDTEHSMEDLSNLSKGISDASADQFIEINKDKEVGDSNDDEDQEGSSEKFLDEGGINASPSPDPCQKFRIEPKSKVAFVSVGKLAPPRTKESGLAKKEVTADYLAKSATDKEDSLFSLLTAGQFKNNIF